MKNLAIVNNISKSLGRFGLQAKKHGPEILAAVGTAGILTSGVLACKATLKVNDILDEAKGQIDDIHTVASHEEYQDEYTEADAKKDLTIVYAQTGVKLAKLYAPAVALGVLSIGCMLTSNNILRKRNIALAAAYTTVDKCFKDYRKRVVERFGEEFDRELRYNLKSEKITEIEVDPETGKEKKVKKTITVAENPNGYSEYARFFDEVSPAWDKDPETNLYFLRATQQQANDLLVARKHLFLNEVYDMIGIPRTKAGQVVGWIYDPEKNADGDNFVDFGIYDIHREAVRDFVNGYERSILLDFNVDGPIYDLI